MDASFFTPSKSSGCYQRSRRHKPRCSIRNRIVVKLPNRKDVSLYLNYFVELSFNLFLRHFPSYDFTNASHASKYVRQWAIICERLQYRATFEDSSKLVTTIARCWDAKLLMSKYKTPSVTYRTSLNCLWSGLKSTIPRCMTLACC